MPQILVDYELERDDHRFDKWTVVDRPIGNVQPFADWVHNQCIGRIILGQSRIYFELAEEAVFFKLAYDEEDG